MHSPLGASLASRFLACPGSPSLIAGMGEVEKQDDDWRGRGLAAHELAAVSLTCRTDAWEKADAYPLLDGSDVVAVQEYLDYIRSIQLPAAVYHGGYYGVEDRVGAPDLHPLLWGTIDYWQYDPAEALLDICDYKHGIGVVVSVVRNPQLMYYAFVKLLDFPEARRVRMTIAQPRAPHEEGTIRPWECPAEEILEWGYNILIPGMVKTEDFDAPRVTGRHCQFCPAKLHCSEALKEYDSLAKSSQATSGMTDEELNERYRTMPVVMFVRKAIEAEMMRRLMDGRSFASAKLVQQKSDRVWKSGAEAVFQTRYGDKAFADRKLRSPAQMEELPDAARSVKEWAFKPQNGFTVAPGDDRRKAVTPPSAAATFKGYKP